MSFFNRQSVDDRLKALEGARTQLASELESARRKAAILEGRIVDLEAENKALKSRIGQLEDEQKAVLFPKVVA